MKNQRSSTFSPIDQKFFKRSIILTMSDPIITQLREEVSQMIYRMENVDHICKKTLSKHLRSMKTTERERELKKILKMHVKENTTAETKDDMPPISNNKSSNNTTTVVLENERGVNVVFSPTSQSFFNSIVGDQRTREGRLLERLRGKFEEANDKDNNKQSKMGLMYQCLPCTVNNFSSYLIQLISARYHIINDNNSDKDSNETKVMIQNSLQMMTRKMVFTKLYDICISYNSKVINQKDQLWRKKIKILKTKTQGEMHIDKKFQIVISEKIHEDDKGNNEKINNKSKSDDDMNKRPYELSIKCIEKLDNCRTPDEMTKILLDSIKVIHEEAKLATGAKIGGMDDLLPILVFVLVQSNLHCINRQLAYMENFATNVNNGEASFYMCCLQAGVSWTLNNSDDDDEDDEDETKANSEMNLPLTNYFSSKEEAMVDEELQQWMIGIDMIEDSYDMLL